MEMREKKDLTNINIKEPTLDSGGDAGLQLMPTNLSTAPGPGSFTSDSVHLNLLGKQQKTAKYSGPHPDGAQGLCFHSLLDCPELQPST